MSDKEKANLQAILESCDKIFQFVQNVKDADSFYKDEKPFDAVLMNFIIIGEAVTKLSRQFKEENNTIKWSNIKGFRNILAHNYFGVDAEEVWEIIHSVLPLFSKEITTILEAKRL